MEIGKILICIGVVIILLGIVFMIFDTILPLGHLPGDLQWQWGKSKIYFPLVSCLLISVVGSILLNLFFKR